MTRATLFLAARANLAPETLKFYNRVTDEYVRFHHGSTVLTTERISQFLSAQTCRGNAKHAKSRVLKA